jgi:eukaryotic-like serine/threonine-protein kinase
LPPSASSSRPSSRSTQASPPPAEDAESKRIGSLYKAGDVVDGRYVLIEQLGKGGMGVVWKARSTALDVEVAVKLVRSATPNSDAFKRMAREAHAAARLGHPAMATVLDFGGTPEGAPYVVMELLRGESLGEVLGRERRVDALRAVSTLLPIMDGLREAHEKGIVHRDLKPENLFISKAARGRLQPKVLDFGIAKLEQPMDSATKLTQDGAVLGSPGYFSPEQARGQADIDFRTDIWSISVVLYELITGELPFTGANYNALLMSILKDTPPSITSLGFGDDELWRILHRGLHRDRNKRWPSMWELGRALAGWLYDKGVRADLASRSLKEVWLEPRAASEVPSTATFSVDGPRRRAFSTLIKRRVADTLGGETMSNLISRRGVPTRALGWGAATVGLAALIWTVFAQGGGPVAVHAATPQKPAAPASASAAPVTPPPAAEAIASSPSATRAPPAPAAPAPAPPTARRGDVRTTSEVVAKTPNPPAVDPKPKPASASRAKAAEVAVQAPRLASKTAARAKPARPAARQRVDQEFGF